MTQKNQNETVVTTDATREELDCCLRNHPNAAFEFVVATSAYYDENYEEINDGPLLIKASKLKKELEDIACSHESCTLWPDEWLPNLVSANVGTILDRMADAFTNFGVKFVVASDDTGDPEIMFYEDDSQKEPLASILCDPDVRYNYVEAVCAFYELRVEKNRIIRTSDFVEKLIDTACEWTDTCPLWWDEASPLSLINKTNIGMILNATKDILKGYYVNFWILPDNTDDPDIFFFSEDPVRELSDLMNDPGTR